MITDGLKNFTKTSFAVMGWMVAIVAVVAWRSHGNMLAVCLAAGLPIGVLALWFIVHGNEGSKLDPRVLERNVQVNKIKARRPSVETQTLARMPMPSSGRLKPKTARAVPIANKIAPVEASAAFDMSTVFSLENEKSSGRYDFLDAGNYLYKPSTEKDRKTLDLVGSGPLPSENETPKTADGKAIPDLEIDRKE